MTTTLEQRRARRAARKEAKAPKVYVSRSSRLVSHTPSTMGDYVTERLLRRMRETIEMTGKDLSRFSEKLAEDAYYAFEWSKSPIEAAAKRRAAQSVEARITEAQNQGDEYDRPPNQTIFRWTLQWLRSEVMRGAMYPDRDDVPRQLVAAFAHILQDVEMSYGMYARELDLGTV